MKRSLLLTAALLCLLATVAPNARAQVPLPVGGAVRFRAAAGQASAGRSTNPVAVDSSRRTSSGKVVLTSALVGAAAGALVGAVLGPVYAGGQCEASLPPCPGRDALWGGAALGAVVGGAVGAFVGLVRITPNTLQFGLRVAHHRSTR